MKTIEQLLELSKNPYYEMSVEEQAALDAFLSKKSGQTSPQKDNGSNSEKNIPATVHNKNIVRPEIGVVPLDNNTVNPEVGELEEEVHPDAVK